MTFGIYCPSHCDADGKWYDSFYCTSGSFCCIIDKAYTCCKNVTHIVGDNPKEDLNCYSHLAAWIVQYWRVIISVCLPIGILSVVASLMLCGYLGVKRKRRLRERSSSTRTRCSSTTSVASSYSSGSSPNLDRRETLSGAYNLGEMRPSSIPSPPPYSSGKPPEYSAIFPAATEVT